MSTLTNIPQQGAMLRLAARKSFSFTVQYLDSSGVALNLTGATCSFTIGEQVYSATPILSVQASTIVEASGVALFNLQAAQLDLAPGTYPFEVVLNTEGYSAIAIQDELEIEPSYEVGSIGQTYSEAPSTFGLTAHLQQNRIVVTANSLVLQGPIGDEGPPGRDGNPFGPVAITYNAEGRVATLTIGGLTTSYSYNGDGTIAFDEREGVTRIYNYSAGKLTSITPQAGI